MIRNVPELKFTALPDAGPDDSPLGLSTGAAAIFRRYRRRYGGGSPYRRGNSDRRGAEGISTFTDVRGTAGIKEASYNVAGMDVKVAVASGLG